MTVPGVIFTKCNFKICFRQLRLTKPIHASVGDHNVEKKQYVNEVSSNIPKQTEKEKRVHDVAVCVEPHRKKIKQVFLIHFFITLYVSLKQ